VRYDVPEQDVVDVKMISGYECIGIQDPRCRNPRCKLRSDHILIPTSWSRSSDSNRSRHEDANVVNLYETNKGREENNNKCAIQDNDEL
jgi:hypothetical protein